MTKLIRRILTCAMGIAAVGMGSAFAANASVKSASAATTYSLVNSTSDLVVGNNYVFACNTKGAAAGSLSGAILSSVSATFSSDKKTITNNSGVVEFTLGGTTGAYTFTDSNSKKLGVTEVKKLALGSGTDTWSISISSGTATVSSTNSAYGTMKYNSSSPRFTTYASGQTAIQLYTPVDNNTDSVTDVTLDKTSATLAPSDSITLTATVNGTGKYTSTVTWDSSNDAVATVSNGVVTAVANGTATITATSTFDTTKSATCSITVKTVVDTYSLNGTEQYIYVGNYYLKENGASQPTAVAYNEEPTKFLFTLVDDDTFTLTNGNNYLSNSDTAKGAKFTSTYSVWNIGAPLTKSGTTYLGDYSLSFATATSRRYLTIYSAGPDFRTYAAGSSIQSNISLTPTPIPPASSVSIDQENVTLNVGETTTLTATASGTVTWSSSAPTKVSVGETTGLVTALYAGTATITATCGVATDTITVTVNPSYQTLEGDVLDNTATGQTSSSYAEWANEVVGTSGTSYNGFTAAGYNTIQFKSAIQNDKYTGVFSTASVGRIAKVSVNFDQNTTPGKVVNVYGSMTRYESADDLFDANKQGTLLGTIIYGTSYELTVTGNYLFVGVASGDGAIYLHELALKWDTTYTPEQGFIDTFMHMSENVAGQCSASGANYYALAKAGLFATLSSEQIATFKSNDAYNDAQARYEAWATACGDTKPYVDDYSYQSAKINVFAENIKDNSIAIIAVVASLMLSATGVFFFIRKRKFSK